MPANDEPDTGELRKAQGERETTERELASASDDPAEERQHARRADKASYLEEKLAERERSERDAD
jgi:hypothetical protein